MLMVFLMIDKVYIVLIIDEQLNVNQNLIVILVVINT